MSGALSITFDNLGEAAELELGLWAESRPVGRHDSVIEILPRVLGLLAELEVPATFFVEGINAELYPAALESIAAGGHELALHAWRHERWDELEPKRERELLERGTKALAELGHRPAGFRPPGGRLTEASAGLLREQGYEYVSPSEGTHADGLRVVPFRWPLVDAYHLYPGPLRRQLVGEEGRSGGALPARLRSAVFKTAVRLGSLRGATRLRDAMLAELDALSRRGGHLTLLFHPFLLGWPRTFAALRAVLTRATRGDLTLVRMAEARP